MCSEYVTKETLLTLIREAVDAASRKWEESIQRLEEERRKREAEAEEERRKREAEAEAERKKREAEAEAERKKREAEAEAERRKREAEAEEEQKKYEAERKKNDEAFERRHKKLQKEIGGIGQSNGEYAEQFFQRALSKNRFLGGKEYDDILKNVGKESKDGVEAEYDVVLQNGDSIAIIEIKYKFKETDLNHFLKNVAVFRKLFPGYTDKKIYLGIAGFSFAEDVIKKAKDRGIGILHKDGKFIQHDDENLQEY